MRKQSSKTLLVVAGVVASFIGLAGAIVVLAAKEVVTLELAKLMLVALFGIYVGIGFLIAVYRFVGKLQ